MRGLTSSKSASKRAVRPKTAGARASTQPYMADWQQAKAGVPAQFQQSPYASASALRKAKGRRQRRRPGTAGASSRRARASQRTGGRRPHTSGAWHSGGWTSASSSHHDPVWSGREGLPGSAFGTPYAARSRGRHRPHTTPPSTIDVEQFLMASGLMGGARPATQGDSPFRVRGQRTRGGYGHGGAPRSAPAAFLVLDKRQYQPCEHCHDYSPGSRTAFPHPRFDRDAAHAYQQFVGDENALYGSDSSSADEELVFRRRRSSRSPSATRRRRHRAQRGYRSRSRRSRRSRSREVWDEDSAAEVYGVAARVGVASPVQGARSQVPSPGNDHSQAATDNHHGAPTTSTAAPAPLVDDAKEGKTQLTQSAADLASGQYVPPDRGLYYTASSGRVPSTPEHFQTPLPSHDGMVRSPETGVATAVVEPRLQPVGAASAQRHRQRPSSAPWARTQPVLASKGVQAGAVTRVFPHGTQTHAVDAATSGADATAASSVAASTQTTPRHSHDSAAGWLAMPSSSSRSFTIQRPSSERPLVAPPDLAPPVAHQPVRDVASYPSSSPQPQPASLGTSEAGTSALASPAVEPQRLTVQTEEVAAKTTATPQPSPPRSVASALSGAGEWQNSSSRRQLPDASDAGFADQDPLLRFAAEWVSLNGISNSNSFHRRRGIAMDESPSARGGFAAQSAPQGVDRTAFKVLDSIQPYSDPLYALRPAQRFLTRARTEVSKCTRADLAVFVDSTDEKHLLRVLRPVFVLLGEKAALRNMVVSTVDANFIPRVLVLSADGMLVRVPVLVLRCLHLLTPLPMLQSAASKAVRDMAQGTKMHKAAVFEPTLVSVYAAGCVYVCLLTTLSD